MKNKFVVVGLVITFVLQVSGYVASEQSPRVTAVRSVLIILREGEMSDDVYPLETREAENISRLLEKAGIRVVVASESGGTFTLEFPTVTFRSLKTADVRVTDYDGFVFPADHRKELCYGYQSHGYESTHDTIRIANEAEAEGKLVAAQRWGVVVLAEAGVLVGKHFAFPVDPADDKRFTNAIREGKDVVLDGHLLTVANCPFIDPGVELSKALIAQLLK